MTVDFTAYSYVTINTQTTLTWTIASLTAGNAGSPSLQSFSDQYTAYCDMYRFARIDSLKVILEPSGFSGAGSLGFTGFIIHHVPPGATTPANLLAIETGCSTMVAPSYLGTGTSPQSSHSRGILRMAANDFSPTNVSGGPGRKTWITTQDDSPDTTNQTWGLLQCTTFSPATASGGISFNIGLRWRCTFFQMVDPTTISLKMRSLHVGLSEPASVKPLTVSDDEDDPSSENLGSEAPTERSDVSLTIGLLRKRLALLEATGLRK